jgi:hypothetical protein
MVVAQHSSALKVSDETYTLTLPPDRPFIYVDDAHA